MLLKYWLLLFLSISLLFTGVKAQTMTISGVVKDKSSEETIIGAIVYLKKQNKGTSTDYNGQFSFQSIAGRDTLIVQSTGYKKYVQSILIETPLSLTLYLEIDTSNTKSVLILDNPYTQQLETTQMGKVEITPEEALLLPSLGGEVDMLKVLQLKPGIKNGGEGSAGLYVRGGGPDQNLFLLNGAQIYNPSHLFGFFSVFNTDAVRSIDLYKGDFPSNFGGRLSSVVDVRMRSGDTTFHASGGIGLISSRLTLEGPFANKKGSWLISGRRTYADIFTRQINLSQQDNPEYNPIPDYFFWDLNGNIQYALNKKHTFIYTGYYGRDRFKFKDDDFNFNFTWGNFVQSLQIQSNISTKILVTNSITYSRYKYEIENQITGFGLNLKSQIRDYTIAQDWKYSVDSQHTINVGLQYTFHTFIVARLKAGSDDGQVNFNSGSNLIGQEFGLYFSDTYKWSNKIKTSLGVRYSGFINETFYSGIEPRVSLRYKVSGRQSLKVSMNQMFQYLHLVSNSGASLPTDIWYPSTTNVQPQRSRQVSIGHELLLPGNKIFITNELYYKGFNNVIDFRDGAEIFVNNNLENEFVFGVGRSFGWELYIEKKTGKTTGWIGYTLSKTERRFDSINEGQYFPARYDRRHDISLVIMHKINKRLSCSATWVYGTGNAVSLPVARAFFQDIYSSSPTVVSIYTDRNAFRMAAYHRLDLALIWKLEPKWGYADLTFSIYNVYNRYNPYFIYFDEVKDINDKVIGYQAKQVSLFPVIPSITFNFKW